MQRRAAAICRNRVELAWGHVFIQDVETSTGLSVGHVTACQQCEDEQQEVEDMRRAKIMQMLAVAVVLTAWRCFDCGS